MNNIPFLPDSRGPPWLPAPAAQARQFAYWGMLFTLIMFVVGVIFTIYVMLFYWTYLYGFVIWLILGILLFFLVKSSVFDQIDQGRFHDANIMFLLWSILALFVGLIPGILMLVGWIKFQEVFQPQYAQYQAQPGQVGQAPPQQSQYAPPPPPPPQQAPPAAPAAEPKPAEQQKVDMVKCKKCGVSYPAFMHHCPNCNEPR